MQQPARLPGDRLHQAWVVVPKRRYRDTRERIEIAFACFVEKPYAVTMGKRHWQTGVCVHDRGKWHERLRPKWSKKAHGGKGRREKKLQVTDITTEPREMYRPHFSEE
jgi:hypothetical protein